MNYRAALPPEDSVFRQLAKRMPHRIDSPAEIAEVTARLRA